MHRRVKWYIHDSVGDYVPAVRGRGLELEVMLLHNHQGSRWTRALEHLSESSLFCLFTSFCYDKAFWTTNLIFWFSLDSLVLSLILSPNSSINPSRPQNREQIEMWRFCEKIAPYDLSEGSVASVRLHINVFLVGLRKKQDATLRPRIWKILLRVNELPSDTYLNYVLVAHVKYAKK